MHQPTEAVGHLLLHKRIMEPSHAIQNPEAPTANDQLQHCWCGCPSSVVQCYSMMQSQELSALLLLHRYARVVL